MTGDDRAQIDWEDCPHLHRDPEIRGSQWCFAGTSLYLSHLFDCLASGVSIKKYVKHYKVANPEHIKAILRHVQHRLESIDTRGREDDECGRQWGINDFPHKCHHPTGHAGTCRCKCGRDRRSKKKLPCVAPKA